MDLLARRGIPQAASLHLARRRGQLSNVVRGRVLELESEGVPDHSPLLGAAGALNPLGCQGSTPTSSLVERFDTIVTLGALAAAPSPLELLSMLRQALASDGQLVFIEPALRPGISGRLQQRAGLHTDVVSLIRDAGFTITTLRRHEVATHNPRFRWFTDGIAQRTSELRAND